MSTQAFAFDEILRDGSRVTIRPIKEGDVGIERDFIMRLSPQSRRFRFLSSIAAPSEQLLERLTKLDEATEAAFVARQHGLNALYSVDASENGPMNGFAKALGFCSGINPQDATEVIHTLRLN